MGVTATETELVQQQQHQQQAPRDVETGGVASVKVEPVVVVLPPDKQPVLSSTRAIRLLLRPVAETTSTERIAASVGSLAVLTALMAILVEPSAIAILAGLLSSILGPYLYYQETRLTDIQTLQETKVAVQAEVHRLVQSNLELAQNVGDLTQSVDRLQEIEQALSVINEKSGISVEEFAKQVEENKDLLKKMKGNLKGSVLQNLLSLILRSDANGDFVVDEQEVTDLIRRISNITGVRVDGAKFRAACQGKTIHAVMDVVKNLLRPDVSEYERIFIFDH